MPQIDKAKIAAELGAVPLDEKRRIAQELGAVPSDATSIAPSLLESRRAASRSEFEANQPPSTIGTRIREAGIGLLEPFALQNLVPGIASTVRRGVGAALTGNAMEALDLAKGAVMAPIRPIQNVAQGISEGDYDKAAYGAGGILS